jgi:hypothetical protein
MAPPIRIGPLEEHEAHDLAHALSVRGLVGKVVGVDGRHSVVVRDPHEEEQRFFDEVTVATQAWLNDHGDGRLEIRMRSQIVIVTAPGTIAEVLIEKAATLPKTTTTQPA